MLYYCISEIKNIGFTLSFEILFTTAKKKILIERVQLNGKRGVEDILHNRLSIFFAIIDHCKPFLPLPPPFFGENNPMCAKTGRTVKKGLRKGKFRGSSWRPTPKSSRPEEKEEWMRKNHITPPYVVFLPYLRANACAACKMKISVRKGGLLITD